ncbi:hypothetical protein NEUTE1DRAFT_109336 [Neurospora tetrasperma FGSC 2508]|uniref:Uncharacterized protein n=1 Tax=Neurospora tetrasperma (strain FGSC 2508 / ATCC MYA-4615 / P0657) TaxID=510951 RepID=F8MIY0_NEUT8|nr:uncharacterized protein NEUTE1DRAFT_109336 [Neurospora tetrasperma FGSC 2508]EGO59877.1 hypothetical protein NEUTE1DRAFT_109336 [Neurospora tetrasperma FGSC 2508]EGZ74026.1 hypothetical protein NEUTE2DRAFT_60338 [Neurospora tetrasperma FGSC 2509]
MKYSTGEQRRSCHTTQVINRSSSPIHLLISRSLALPKGVSDDFPTEFSQRLSKVGLRKKPNRAITYPGMYIADWVGSQMNGMSLGTEEDHFKADEALCPRK